jgi:hypothetical protein
MDQSRAPRQWGGRYAQRLVALTLRTKGTVCHLCGLPGADSADHDPPRSVLVAQGEANPDQLEYLWPAHFRPCNNTRRDQPITPALRARLREARLSSLGLTATRPDLSPRFAARRPTTPLPAQVAGRRTVVAGPPCSGKTTYVAEHASPSALVIDWDAIAQRLGSPHSHHHPPSMFASIDAEYRALLAQVPYAEEAWIIRSLGSPTERAEWAERYDAEVLVLRPDIDTLTARALDRPDPDRTVRDVHRWFAEDEGSPLPRRRTARRRRRRVVLEGSSR